MVYLADCSFKISPKNLCELLESTRAIDENVGVTTYTTPENQRKSNGVETKEFLRKKGYALNVFTKNNGQITFHKKTTGDETIYLSWIAYPTEKDALMQECITYGYDLSNGLI
ncbi:MAG: hypothetical protein KAI53_05260 [Candidatus Aenigmarchaeota archaeon]|nr:hypothetical protein [Candidatus Aenigmarchaeota archaeon]